MRRGLIAAALVALIAALVGAANAKSATAKVAVSQGPSSALLQHSGSNDTPPVFPIDDNTPASTPEDVSFILNIQNQSQLESLVSNGMNGGHYLSTGQFARQYGQSQNNIDALTSYLQSYGIQTTVMPDGLDVQANGTAGQFDNALSVHQRDYKTAAIPAHDGHPAVPARKFHGASKDPLLPKQLASFVEAILGLSNYPTFSSDAIRVPQSKNDTTLQLGDRTPEDFATDYNVPSGSGSGSTIGIVTLAALDQQSAEQFWSDVLNITTKANRLDVVNVDGGPGDVSDQAGSGETTLDVEQSGAIAPQANITVYQAPNTDPGFLDAFFQAASDNQADSVSASWGEAETVINWAVQNGLESPGYQGAFDEAFLELAAQGQSTFVSSGDAGAYDDSDELGTTNLDVDSPGNSPWVTSSGGTTLPGIIPLAADSNGNITDSATIAAERAWSWTWLWPHYSDFCFLFSDPSDCTEPNFAIEAAAAGDGGGYSALEPMPTYQRQIPGIQHYNATEFLTPTEFDSTDFAPLTVPVAWDFNPSPSVQSGNAHGGRGEPDLSADADPFTGYELYFSFGEEPGSPAPPTLQAGWGGTSFVAPQLNGTTAVIDANLGHRVGFWNPQIYSSARSHNSPFTVLDSASTDNNNLFYTGSPHQLWNAATGLGTPDLTALQSDFAHPGH
ncbi:MAG TPA: S53 family peptidase [Gaiellaceae bacterium]|nr:S53 family peptidase [Gaiellaceae bacterium]